MRALLSLLLSVCLVFEQSVFAQSIDLSHYFPRNPSQNLSRGDKFRPLHLRYISYDRQANDFKILLDKGDFFNQRTEELKNPALPAGRRRTLEPLNSSTPKLLNSPNSPNSLTPRLDEATQELMKYFSIGLALPNDKFWVNLRPDSPDNILDPDLEKTDIGRVFLEADLQLKKDTASFTSPQTPEGKAYWDKLYNKAGELFGSENIAIPTVTRPWIVPNEIVIREAPDNAYIYKATLKVMLEEDYLDNQKTEKPKNIKTKAYTFQDQRLKELNEYSTRLIKEAIIPKLTYEVNTSKRYAPLRQVYYSLILAQWFKQKYGSLRGIRAPVARAPVNNYINLIDSGNLVNLISSQSYDKQAYFQQYQKSFKDGEYSLQEPVYTPTGQVIRRYMSGGITMLPSASSVIRIKANRRPFEGDYLRPGSVSETNFDRKLFALFDLYFKPGVEEYDPELNALREDVYEKLGNNPNLLNVKAYASKFLKIMKLWGNEFYSQEKENALYEWKHSMSYNARPPSYIDQLAQGLTTTDKIIRKFIEMFPEIALRELLEIFHSSHSGILRESILAAIDSALKSSDSVMLYLTQQEYNNLFLSVSGSDSYAYNGYAASILKEITLKQKGINISQKYLDALIAKLLISADTVVRYDKDYGMQPYVFMVSKCVSFIKTALKKDAQLNVDQERFEIIVNLLPRAVRSKDKEFYGNLKNSIKFILRRNPNLMLEANQFPGNEELSQLCKQLEKDARAGGDGGEPSEDAAAPASSAVYKPISFEEKVKALREYAAMPEEVFRKPVEWGNGGIKSGAIFHGTDIYFTSFSIVEDLSDSFGSLTLGAGVYFVDNPEQANEYAKIREIQRKGTARVMAARLIRDNLLDCRDGVPENVVTALAEYLNVQKEHMDPGQWYLRNRAVIWLGYIDRQRKKGEPIFLRGKGGDGDDIAWMISRNPDNFANLIRGLGYDGIIDNEGGEGVGEHRVGNHVTIVIFDPNNIITYDMVKDFKKSAMPDDKTSSPLGGIAFNALPIQTEAVASSILAALPGVRAFKGDLEAEWAQIQAVFNAGIRPSAQRLADWTAAACASPLDGQRREDILKLIAGILRRDEEDKRLISMDPTLKNLLNALEATL